jgi:single-strand DNA-binding protein
MRGIETAFWGVLGKDPQLKTSKNGKAFTNMNVVVTVGQADDGKDANQWLRVACFGATAENIAARAKKGDRIYVEGSLTMPGTNSRPPASHCAGPAAPRPHSSTDGFDFDRGHRLPW